MFDYRLNSNIRPFGAFSYREIIMSKAQDILAKLRGRNPIKEKINRILNPINEEPKITKEPLSSSDWLRFKARFIQEYNGEEVQQYSGMTHSEFLEYIKSGYKENSEFDRKSLKEILRKMETGEYW